MVNVHKARDLHELHTGHIGVQSVEFFRFEVHFLDQSVNGSSTVFRSVKGDCRLGREFIVQRYAAIVVTDVLLVQIPINMPEASTLNGNGLAETGNVGISESLSDMLAEERDRFLSDISCLIFLNYSIWLLPPQLLFYQACTGECRIPVLAPKAYIRTSRVRERGEKNEFQ